MAYPHFNYTANSSSLGLSTFIIGNSKLLAIGGFDTDSNASQVIQIFDPTTLTWSNYGTLPGTMSQVAAVALDSTHILILGILTVTGGNDFSTVIMNCSGGTPSFATKSSRSAPATSTGQVWACKIADGTVLVFDGFSGSFPSEKQLVKHYDPTGDTWTSKAQPNDFIQLNADPLLLSDGRVMIAGGFGNDGSQSWVYTPGSDTWASYPLASGARYNHRSALLSTGAPCVTGGRAGTSFPSFVYTVEDVFNISTNVWTAGNSMNTARIGHAITTLPDGSLFVAGGQSYDDNIRIIPNAEQRSVSTGLWSNVGSIRSIADGGGGDGGGEHETFVIATSPYLHAALVGPFEFGASFFNQYWAQTGPAGPTVTGFTPGSAQIGDTISVTGTGFSNPATEADINFAPGTSLSIANDTHLTFVAGAFSTTGKVQVWDDEDYGESSATLTIGATGPTLDTFSAVLSPGQTATITGTGLDTTTSCVWNGLQLPFVINSSTQITITAVFFAGTRAAVVTVTNTGGSTATSGNLSLTAGITGFTPSAGYPTGTIILEGGPFDNVSSVHFIDQATSQSLNASFVHLNEKEIEVTVPAVTVAHTYKITITDPIGTRQFDGYQFTATASASFTSVSVASGYSGDVITISGTGFVDPTYGPVVGSITFNGFEAIFQTVDINTITAIVPYNASTGPLLADSIVLLSSFTVNPPATRFSVLKTGNFGGVWTLDGSLLYAMSTAGMSGSTNGGASFTALTTSATITAAKKVWGLANHDDQIYALGTFASPNASAPYLTPESGTFVAADAVTVSGLGAVGSFIDIHGITPLLVAVVASPSSAIITSTDLGDTWTLAYQSANTTFRAVWINNVNDIWAVGDGGVVAHFNGTAWSKTIVDANQNLTSIFSFEPASVYVIGQGINGFDTKLLFSSTGPLGFSSTDTLRLRDSVSGDGVAYNSIFGGLSNTIFAVGTDSILHIGNDGVLRDVWQGGQDFIDDDSSFFGAIMVGTDVFFASASAIYHNGLPVARSITPPQGSPSGGTVIVISGDNFISGLTLSLDGMSLSPSNVTRTSITTTTTAHPAGLGTLRIILPDSTQTIIRFVFYPPTPDRPDQSVFDDYPGLVLYYLMAGENLLDGSNLIYWLSPWEPDTTGLFAPLSISSLGGIYVINIFWAYEAMVPLMDPPPIIPVMEGGGSDTGQLFRSSTPVPMTGPAGPVGVHRVYSVPMLIPTDVPSLVAKIANRSYSASNGATTQTTLAFYASDGNEIPAGSSLGGGAMTIPANGAFASSASIPVVLGPDNKIVLLYDFPDPVFFSAAHCTLGLYAQGIDTVDPPPGSWSGPDPNPNYWMAFEYTTSRPRFIVLGDSISVGYSPGDTVGFNHAAWNRIAKDNNFAVNIQGVVGISMATYSGDVPFLYDQISDIMPGANVIIQLGTNDLAYNTLATMQSVLQTLIATAQGSGAANIYAWTVPPQAAYVSTDTVRGEYNTWLLANYSSIGLAGVYDAAASEANGGLASNSNMNALADNFDSGDGTHPSLVGQLQIKAGWEGVIAGGASAIAFRSAFPIPNSGELVNGGTPTVYKRPMYIPSDVTEVTLRLGNRWSNGGVTGGAAITSNIAIYQSDGTGQPTGSPLGEWLSQTIPGNGSDLVTPTTTIQRGTDGKIVLLNSIEASAVVTSCGELTHGTYAAATNVVNPAPADSGSDPNPILMTHFDFSTKRRRIITLGDSISVGVLAETGFEASCFYLLGPENDYAIEQLGLPGGGLSTFAQFGGSFANLWADGVFNAGVEVWIQLGVNDIPSGPTSMESNLSAIVSHLRVLGVSKIYANTVPAQDSYSDSSSATRLAYNNFLRSNSLQLTGIADFDTQQSAGGLNDNTDPTVLWSAFSVDGTHWTDAGHAQAYALVIGVLGLTG